MVEEWKEIDRYDGDYFISNLGRILSKKGKSDRLLKLSKDKNGYLVTCLCANSITQNVKAHRLVALYFLEKPPNKNDVNHIDGNKTNNSSNNLEWVTHMENVQHANKSELIKNRGNSHYRFKGVIFATEICTGKIIEMRGRKEILENGFDAANVYAALQGKYSQLNGFHFHREKLA